MKDLPGHSNLTMKSVPPIRPVICDLQVNVAAGHGKHMCPG